MKTILWIATGVLALASSALACVVLGLWHCHTDKNGIFSWSAPGSVPAVLPLKVYKRYNSRYEAVQRAMSLTTIEQDPIILKKP